MRKCGAMFLMLVLLSLGCAPSLPATQYPTQSGPAQTRIPTTIPTEAATLPPLPDLMQEINIFGVGAGGGEPESSLCEQFSLPSASSAIGGTTYFTERPADDFWWLTYPYTQFPRHAELCISGIPRDQLVTVTLTSSDQSTTLSAIIKITDDPESPGDLVVMQQSSPQNRLVDGAAREIGGSLVEASISLWWAGGLPNGNWRIGVRWGSHEMYGEFSANARSLPEISLSDPESSRTLFFTKPVAATCHWAPPVGPYVLLAEGFPANSEAIVLIYHAISIRFQGGTDMEFERQLPLRTNELGSAEVMLPSVFRAGQAYFVFSTAPGAHSAEEMLDLNGRLDYPKIANAMDCFVMP